MKSLHQAADPGSVVQLALKDFNVSMIKNVFMAVGFKSWIL